MGDRCGGTMLGRRPVECRQCSRHCTNCVFLRMFVKLEPDLWFPCKLEQNPLLQGLRRYTLMLKGPRGVTLPLSTGEPCFFEVYGSSARLAFSRYFVVAHVDGFLYVLDKYFCIFRLVPSRVKRSCSSLTDQARRSGSAGPGPPISGISPSEAIRNGEQGDGRPLVAEQQHTGVCSYQMATEEDHLEGNQLLVPVRIADVISALFRAEKRAFSQLFTGNNQYDQRQLQGLRQKSLLLSNHHDGCLYLFLKKFLLRVSLRGAVTVVGDLLELALAAASRLRVSGSLGSAYGGTATSASSHLLRDDDGTGRQGDIAPLRRICSVGQLCRELAHDEDASSNCSDATAREHASSTPNFENAAEEEQERGSPGSGRTSTQEWEYLRSMHDWARIPTEQYPDSLFASGRLQEFIASRGENWEVNNCCIDGEGRCFFTVARSKAMSPVEERGMVFCLDTKGPVARAVVLRFGRGITQSEVLSLSLAAHPNSGCILMVAKSAAKVRTGLISPAISPHLSLATDCHQPLGNAVATAISGGLNSPEVGAGMSRASSACAVGEAGTLAALARLSTTQYSNGVPSAGETTVTGQGSESAIQRSRDNTIIQAGTGDDAADYPIQGGMRDQARHRASTNRSVGNLQPPNYPTAPREEARSAHREGQQALDEERNELVAEEHSSWWFCPCDDDPSFFYPVSECFDDDAIHGAAQSICRQFRGSASSSVCRAYFEDNSGSALREAKAAAAAARTAELTIAATIQAEEQRDWGLGLKCSSTLSVASAKRESCKGGNSARTAALKALREADLATSRAECTESSGYILWQPGVKVRRPKTGEEAINFGSAMLFRARTTFRRETAPRWITGKSPSLQLPCASDFITGGNWAGAVGSLLPLACGWTAAELVAVISQDARHLEVRDALPSPLGLIVVPAEAANRIVKQQPDGVSGRMTSRSNISLTSFLASFIAGSSSGAPEREDLGGVTTPTGQGSVEDARRFAAESQVAEPPLAGATTSVAYTNAMQDNAPRRPVPAVNIVFLVDTLRVCRLAEAKPTQGSLDQSSLPPMRNQRLLGLADAASGAACDNLTHESSQSWKEEKKREQQSAGGLPISDTLTQSPSDCKGSSSCSCGKASASLGDLPTPVLHSHFADVTLLCADGYEVSSHRALLAARCSFFEAKLTRPHWEAREADKVVIDLRGFAGSVVQTTVRFFETGYFVIPSSCCCPHCCVERRSNRNEQYQAPQQRGLPPYESHCCCKVDWVLQAYTFAAYCLLQDLKNELLAVLARLTSQRTCLHVLTHPAVRNQRRILQLAAHQLVYHMPMPNLLLEVDSCRDWRLPPADNSSSKSQEKSPPGGGRTQRQKRRKHLLTQLLSEGVYDVVIKALSAWVLDTQENIVLLAKLHFLRNCDTLSPRLRPRQLLVLLALRLLQESVTAPLSARSVCRGPPNSPYNVSRKSRTSSPTESHSGPESTMPTWERPDKISLVVPLRDSHAALRYFLFRDVVLLWAKVLDVPEEEAKIVAHEVEYSCLP